MDLLHKAWRVLSQVSVRELIFSRRDIILQLWAPEDVVINTSVVAIFPFIYPSSLLIIHSLIVILSLEASRFIKCIKLVVFEILSVSWFRFIILAILFAFICNYGLALQKIGRCWLLSNSQSVELVNTFLICIWNSSSNGCFFLKALVFSSF